MPNLSGLTSARPANLLALTLAGSRGSVGAGMQYDV